MLRDLCVGRHPSPLSDFGQLPASSCQLLRLRPVAVALAFGGPMLFDGFKTPAVSLGISLVIGAAAGLSNADDTGRRYLIGVAEAAQSGVFAVWIGVAAVLGFPDTLPALARITTLALNVVALATAACASYGFLGLRCGSASHR